MDLAEWRKQNPDWKPTYKSPFEKLAEAPTLKKAITAKCCECMGWEAGEAYPHGLKDDVRNCTSKTCPLYGFRPWK